MSKVEVEAHPLLEVVVLSCVFPQHLGEASTEALLDQFSVDYSAPLSTGDDVKLAVRDLLRVGGFKPSGRSKPASEYLIKAASGGFLSSINKAVDVCNVVSLHSGLPISVVDRERVNGELSIAVVEEGTRYVFNASGQEIDLSGLICLRDEQGPCANAVKDSQRTKTNADSSQCLYVFWGTSDLPGRAQQAADWAAELLVQEGAVEVEQLPNATS